MRETTVDKRSRKRVAAKVPATIKHREGTLEHSAVTRDLSMGGVFLYTNARIEQGSKLQIVLILPPELGLGEKQWACCEASVIRVEGEGSPHFGVAATIDRLDVLPEIPT